MTDQITKLPSLGGLAPAATRRHVISQFQSDVSAIAGEKEPIQARLTVFTLLALLVSLVGVSLVFPIDRVVDANFGQVVTTEPTMVVQALDTSLIKTIDVLEGQIVKRGQRLATLDPTLVTADYDALLDQIASLNAQIARAKAELAHQAYVPERDTKYPQYGELQLRYFSQRKAQYDAQVTAFDEQIAQSRATLAKYGNEQKMEGSRNQVASHVQDMRRKLTEDQVGSVIDLLTAIDARLQVSRDEQTDADGVIETTHLLAATVSNKEAFIQQWYGQASLELLNAKAQLDQAEQQAEKAQLHQKLVRLIAPYDAVVLSIAKLSVGSVLKEGDVLMDLAPLDSHKEAEIVVAARDVGFIRAGDPVTIKLDAFDFVEHGTAEGRVLWISENTFNADPTTAVGLDGQGPPVFPYYKVRVALTAIDLHNVPASFRLIPGMTMTADIHVGRRSLFLYLIKGLVRSVNEAMREP